MSRKIGTPAAAHHAIVSSGSPPRTGPGSGGTKCSSASMLASASSICEVPSQSRPLSSGDASAAGRTTRRSATQGATGNDSPDACSVLAPAGVPIFLLIVLVVWRDAPPALVQAAAALFVVGVGVLLWRMPHRRDPDDDDTGAVV